MTGGQGHRKPGRKAERAKGSAISPSPVRRQERTCFRASYSVLVLRNPSARAQAHQRVNAICLELNLVGRGATVQDALDDLSAIVFESCKEEWEQLLPAPRPDPDPDVAAVFRSHAGETSEGEQVLHRLRLCHEIEFTRQVPAKGRPGRGPVGLAPTTVYEACSA